MPPPPEIPSTPAGDDQAEAIRRRHLTHEASVQSIGTLYLIGAVLVILGSASGVVLALIERRGATLESLAVSAIPLVLGGIYIIVGRWLRLLDPKGRMPATLLAVIGLIAFPIGTLINGYILYLLQSKKGATVFSPEYREIIAATPHIKYKTSLLAWAVLILLVVGLLLLVASAM